MKHLTAKPDWSAVLTLVARQFDDQLMMTGFQLDSIKNNRIRTALGPLAKSRHAAIAGSALPRLLDGRIGTAGNRLVPGPRPARLENVSRGHRAAPYP